MPKKTIPYLTMLCLSVATSYAAGPVDVAVLGEQCRQVAVKMDTLSRYQDRPTCSTYLNGLNVYFASQFIIAKQLAEAKPLIETAITQIKFAIDIGCYGQNDMKNLVKDLLKIKENIV